MFQLLMGSYKILLRNNFENLKNPKKCQNDPRDRPPLFHKKN